MASESDVVTLLKRKIEEAEQRLAFANEVSQNVGVYSKSAKKRRQEIQEHAAGMCAQARV